MLSQRWSRVLHEIRELYRELDAEVAAFASKSGMSCPPGCGACCLSPHVESTVAELLPMAEHLFATAQIENMLERLERGTSLCAQYEAGRCLNYAQRPALCRLFGYRGARDKKGRIHYAACHVLRERESEKIDKVEEALEKGAIALPVLSQAHERVSAIAGSLGEDIMPINQALMHAIQIVGLNQSLNIAPPAGTECQPPELFD